MFESDEECYFASPAREEAIEKARAKGHLTAEERNGFVATLTEADADALENTLQRTKMQLKHSSYRAASADDSTGYADYTTMQHSSEKLKLCWLMKEWRAGSEHDFPKFCSVLRLQCLCRWYLARCVYRDLLAKRKERDSSELVLADQTEAAILIQTLARRLSAKKRTATRRRSLRPVDHSEKQETKDETHRQQTEDTEVRVSTVNEDGLEGRRFQLPAAGGSEILPSYTVHDVSNVPVTDAELRKLFASLTPTDTLSKEDFKKHCRTQETFGVDGLSHSLDAVIDKFDTSGMWLSSFCAGISDVNLTDAAGPIHHPRCSAQR